MRVMTDRMLRRLRFAFKSSDEAVPEPGVGGPEEVDFVAYGEDCVLSGRTVLDGDRLTDMLNDHDEYALAGVTVERFDGGPPIQVDEIVVARDEVWLIHASGPRGDAARRHRTMPQHVALKMGPYKVRGFFHALPGTDPAAAIRRRKAMVPLTGARVEYTVGNETREVRVETVIVNREHVEWIEEVEPDRAEFPAGPKRVQPDDKPRLATDLT